jgi:hypothetical protein
MEQHVFRFFYIVYRGHHRKGVAITMPLRSIYKKILVSLNKYSIFEHHRTVQTKKNLSIDIIFAMKTFFW